ncbi:MAG: ABC transporter permease [Acidimicrobiales bacterium]|nr:ABC transporter permease [Acidimicrobiales bacterium]
MLKTTLRSLWSHKLRLALSMLSIVLGVSFMSGTLVLNSTVGRVFDDLFAKLGENVDAVVRGKVLYENDQGGDTVRTLLPDSIVAKVRAVDGVAAAEGSTLTTKATIIDAKGDAMGGAGPPTIIGSWTVDKRMSSYQIDRGRAPTRPGEAILDRGGMDKGGFEIGSRVEIIGLDGKPQHLTIVGVSRFGEADSAGGSIFLGVTLPEAQRIAGEPGKLNQVDVRAEPGVSQEELVRRLKDAKLAKGLDIVTGEKASQEMASDVKQGLNFFTTALLVFAFIALFVAAFIISNTFSILFAQRTKELALLRAIGATRRQVLTSSLTEAAMIGAISSIVGFLAGIGLAAGALALLDALGVDLPRTNLLVTPATAVKVFATGVIVTLVSAAMPAIRATRVPPIAALRSTAVESRRAPRLRTVAGILLGLLGAFLIMPAFAAEPSSDDLPRIGGGLGCAVLALLLLGPAIARPISRVIGSWLPRVRGAVGNIARENAMRSPRRTASTAAALIIGVALVVFITIFAASARQTIDNSLGTGFRSDYIILPVNQQSEVGADPSMARRLAEVPGVSVVDATGFVVAQAELSNGDKTLAFAAAIRPQTFSEVYDAKMAEGSLAQLVPGTVVVDKTTAKDHGIAVGDKIRMVGTGDRRATLRVVAISNDPIVLGQWTIHRDDVTKLAPATTDVFVGVSLKPGTSVDSVRGDLRAIVRDYPNMKLQDKDQFRNSIVSLITGLLNVIFGLLAVSIVIAFIGILNTMILAIHERTRELGLLRAMGMTRGQMRAAVRWEAVIVSLMGAGLGMLLGLGLSYVMVRALRSQGIDQFAVPVSWMVTIAVAAVVFGIVAATWPAYKAGKLNVLEAIATE